MGTWPECPWKHRAVAAAQGDDMAIVRINGIRYIRQLVRITEGPELEGVVAKKRAKYRSRIMLDHTKSGETWEFKLAPYTDS